MPEIRAVHDGERAPDSPIMSSTSRVCRKCGAEIFADAPEGLCTACLFQTGLHLLAHDGQSTCEGGSASPKTINAFGERVPPQKAERIPPKTSPTLATMNYWKKSVEAAKEWFIARGRKVSTGPLH